MKRTVLALLVLGLAPLVASAAVSLSWSLQYVNTFDGAGYAPANDLGSVFTRTGNTLTATGAISPNAVSRFAVYLQAGGLSATDFLTFASADVNIGQVGGVFTPHLTPVTNFPINASISGVTGYPVDATFQERPAYWNTTPGTTNVYTRNGSFFAFNSARDTAGDNSFWLPYNNTNHVPGDLGTPNDLMGLRSEIHYDPDFSSLRPGIDAPLLWGYVFLKWDGTPADITVQTGPPTGAAWGSNELGDQSSVSATQISQTVSLVVPEPATMALLVLGGVGVLARRRRA